MFYGVQVRDGLCRCLVLCSVTHSYFDFDVCFWITVLLEDPNMAHYKISSRGCQIWIVYLLVFDRILDALYLNKKKKSIDHRLFTIVYGEY